MSSIGEKMLLPSTNTEVADVLEERLIDAEYKIWKKVRQFAASASNLACCPFQRNTHHQFIPLSSEHAVFV
jgi:hypothetical protein